MFSNTFKRSVIAAAVTIILDLIFHITLTHPMESFTYFTLKFFVAFFIAMALFSLHFYVKSRHKNALSFITGLIFSFLWSVYYRAWEAVEAGAPFGSRAPDILGINRENVMLFGGVWWIAHGMFFFIGVLIAEKLINER